MFFNGLGAATPANKYKQPDCWQALSLSEQFASLTPRSRAILKKVLLGSNGIATRYLALDPLEEVFQATPDLLHERFLKHAPLLATQAANRALADAHIAASAIDAIIISTCTGYLCPGLTSYVSERLGLRADVSCVDLVGQGCGAALPNLRMAEALIASGRCENVLSVCVEVCSAAFYLDDDPGVLISACLFGDGAGAAVLSKTPKANSRRIKWLTSSSVLAPEHRELLRFETKNGMLRNILAPEVPERAAKHAQTVLAESLNKTAVRQTDISTWIFHAGGRDVLLALRDKLGLATEDLCWSARVLEEYGNMSSAFVYFVLRSALEGRAPDGKWWLASFGAGFSSHGALLQVG